MRILSLLIFLNYFTAFSQLKHEKTLKDFGLSEGVTKTIENQYDLILFSSSNGEPLEQYKLKETKKKYFNSNGFLVIDSIIRGQKYYHKDFIKYSYDENNLLKEVYKMTGMRDSNNITNIYNSDNILIKQIDSSLSRLYSHILSYNNNRIVSKKFIIKDYRSKQIEIANETNYYYNEIDSISSKKFHNFFDNTRVITNYTYKNKLKYNTEKHYKNDSFVKKNELATSYGNNGKIIKLAKKRYDTLGKILVEINQEFNSYGLEIFWDFKSRDGYDSKTFKYDNYQNILEIVTNRNQQETHKRLFSYKYDDRGNWLIKCEKEKRDYKYKNSIEPLLVTKRKIYYDDGNLSKRISKKEALSFCAPDYRKRLEKFLAKENSNPKLIIKEIEEPE